MLKRVLPLALVIILLFSSFAFAGGQGNGGQKAANGEPKVMAQMGPGFDEERMPGNPRDDEEWAPFTYCYGYGYGYGYAYDRLNVCTDGSCICTDGSCICTDGCCEYFFQHQWRWPCELPDLTDPPELPDESVVTEP
ncbi:hypothetical protein SANA_29610 [Gottschalkiaceae bacterium SANA]|nr:hypothetical protein SANA_29610 [Gottschalkiaceae bacterium SANA]